MLKKVGKYIFINKIKIDALFTVNCIHKHKAHRPITGVFLAFMKIKKNHRIKLKPTCTPIFYSLGDFKFC